LDWTAFHLSKIILIVVIMCYRLYLILGLW